jgi:2-hydroxychromene-2-carboxylate isomerase
LSGGAMASTDSPGPSADTRANTSVDTRAPIDFYFDFISSYGYFASLRIDAIAARHGHTVQWHAMLLGVSVMKVMGLKPLLETPLKGDYVLLDTARYMRRHGLALVRQISDPMMDPRPAARAFYWVRRHHPGCEAAFARALYDRYWRLGKDLSLSDEIAAVAAAEPALGIDPDALRAGEASDEARHDLREAVATSIDRGVFGSPFILVDGEPFWGSDRLDVLDDWLARGGW